MNKYAVHVYTSVRIKLEGVLASNHKEAVQIADGVDLSELLDRQNIGQMVTSKTPGGSHELVAKSIEHDEGASTFLVDPIKENGEVDYNGSKDLDDCGMPLVHAHTKEVGYDRAARFLDELLESVETLSAIAEEHGPVVLANMLYLHSAIMKGTWIDTDSAEADSQATLDIVGALPSATEWLKFTRDTEQSVPGPRARG